MDKAMIKSLEERIEALKQNVAAVLVGRERATEYILSALVAGGHVLLED